MERLIRLGKVRLDYIRHDAGMGPYMNIGTTMVNINFIAVIKT